MFLRFGTNLLFILFLLPWATAYPENSGPSHGGSQTTATNPSRATAQNTNQTAEEQSLKKRLNEAADGDSNLKEGREKIQSAVDSIWSSLSTEQKAELEKETASGKTEKLDSLLTEKGLVLSSKEKRAKFLSGFQIQLSANAKRGSSKGIAELIKDSKLEAKGDPKKRQQQLAAKETLRVESEKNKALLDYMKKNLGWSSEDSLLTLKRVEEQSKLLGSGTPKEKAAAQDYLYRVFGQIYGAGMKNADKSSNAITELFANSDVRNSDFGKIGRQFVTAGMGQNFTSKENPYGACAGVECARDFIAEALTKSSLKGTAETPQLAVDQMRDKQTLPLIIKTEDGSVVPTLTDEGVKSLANIYSGYDNYWLGSEKEKFRQKANLDNAYDVDKALSFKSQQNLDAFLDRPDIAGRDGATIWVSKKNQVPQSDGSMKETISGHVVTMSKMGSGSDKYYLVRDPNFKGLSFDATVNQDGKFSYSYPSIDGSKTTFEWDNFFPSPGFWESENYSSTK